MINKVSILGSTGSIGRQSLEICRENKIEVRAISCGANIALAEKQAREFNPRLVAVHDEMSAKSLKTALADTDIVVVSGMDGLVAVAAEAESECVITAVSGSVGLMPTLAAISEGKRIGLANKETLVCAGEIVMAAARKSSVDIIPVDSEHSAIFQCLAGAGEQEFRIILTASGGPFRGRALSGLENVSAKDALKHPNWSMGAKISIDSATMMNKGLELIEAMHLFDCKAEDIEVVIHPESIIHSAVEFGDGSVIAQLGVPDMKLPIQYALTWPRRGKMQSERLDLTKIGQLNFEAPDMENLPCLRLAIESAKRGGTAPTVLSAANEVAVAMFLNGEIGFNDIARGVEAALMGIEFISSPTIEEIQELDMRARVYVKEKYS